MWTFRIIMVRKITIMELNARSPQRILYQSREPFASCSARLCVRRFVGSYWKHAELKYKKYISPKLLRMYKLSSENWWYRMIIFFHLSKLWKSKFFMLCDVIFLVKLQEKSKSDHSSAKGSFTLLNSSPHQFMITILLDRVLVADSLASISQMKRSWYWEMDWKWIMTELTEKSLLSGNMGFINGCVITP